MKFQTIANFGQLGGTIEGGRPFVACAIAMSSEVDIALVGSNTLAPMGIVPCEPGMRIDPIRGYRTGSTTSLGSGPPLASSSLVLQLYEPHDLLVPPGPRAPLVRAVRLAAIGAAAATATLAFRLPFMGRSEAVICASRADTDTNDATLIIRGVRYLTAAERAQDGTPDQGYITEQTKNLWDGAAAQPTSVITATDKLKGVVYVGGDGDYEEAFDELEVWIYGAVSTAVNLQAEVYGERGR